MSNSRSNALKLFSLGFLTLFLELVLIRYLAGNIWNLGYFPNLVLLGVFVGMGIGFVFHHYIPDSDSGRYFNLSAVVLAVLVAFVTFMHPSLPGFGLSAGNIGGDLYF